MAQHILTDVHPEIRTVLKRLRRSIRMYVLLEGAAFALVILGILFWASFALDWAYFQLSTLELPVWFRIAFSGIAVLLLAVFVIFLLMMLTRSLRSKALALVLEHRFPDLDDRLITAVELAESTTGKESALTAAMINRTVGDAARAATSLNVADVFDNRPLRRAIITAAVLVVSIGGLALANDQAIQRWKRAFINWDEEYWNRDTLLRVKVIAQPGDRIREFEDFVYKHPRGGDLTLLIEVPETKPDGTPWKVPDRVELRYQIAGELGTGRALCTRVGDRQFKFAEANLLDGRLIWVKGGDFINRRPYEIVVVDPPRVDEIVLECDYPHYTGLNAELDAKNKKVQGTQVSLPMETRFVMHATSNKELVSVRIQYADYELVFGYGSNVNTAAADSEGMQATLTRKSEPGQPQVSVKIPDAVAQKFLSADRRSLNVPFVVSTVESDAARTRAEAAMGGFGQPFVIPPDSLLRIYLEDTDEITSSDPSRLTINGVTDNPPLIETELRGISASITRKAKIPVAGLISDDYGVVKARFDFGVDDFRVDGEEVWREWPFDNSPKETPKDFKLKRSDRQAFEQFDVRPHELKLGQKITLTVFAQDGDNLNGPNISRGQRYVFKIVSDEELASILYGKEVNLRRRFEKIIEEVEDTKKDFILHRVRVQEAALLRDETPQPNNAAAHRENIRQIETAVAASAERGLHQIRKNDNETKAIVASFRDILDEWENNRLITEKMRKRIDELIVDPLDRIIIKLDFPRVDRAVGSFRLANEKGIDPTPRIDESVEAIDTMLAHMQQVLAEIKDLAEFHEAVKNLQFIIDAQEELAKETKSRGNKSILDDLKGDDEEEKSKPKEKEKQK